MPRSHHRRSQHRRRDGRSRLSAGLLFVLAGAALGAPVMLLGLETLAWPWPAAHLAGINLATAFLHGYDKLAAGRGGLRVPEATLHLFALLGGTPAAFLAQRLFRHKTLSAKFLLVFWLIVAAQAAALVAWWRWT